MLWVPVLLCRFPKVSATDLGTETDTTENQQLVYHVLGQPQSQDVVVLADPDHPVSVCRHWHTQPLQHALLCAGVLLPKCAAAAWQLVVSGTCKCKHVPPRLMLFRDVQKRMCPKTTYVCIRVHTHITYVCIFVYLLRTCMCTVGFQRGLLGLAGGCPHHHFIDKNHQYNLQIICFGYRRAGKWLVLAKIT
jgi:hypothetical protein